MVSLSCKHQLAAQFEELDNKLAFSDPASFAAIKRQQRRKDRSARSTARRDGESLSSISPIRGGDTERQVISSFLGSVASPDEGCSTSVSATPSVSPKRSPDDSATKKRVAAVKELLELIEDKHKLEEDIEDVKTELEKIDEKSLASATPLKPHHVMRTPKRTPQQGGFSLFKPYAKDLGSSPPHPFE